MVTQQYAGVELGNMITEIFFSEEGKSYTDIYIQPGIPFRARVSSREWIDVSVKGEKKIYSADQFNAAMASFFANEKGIPDHNWRDRVDSNGKCAYPVFPIVKEEVEINSADGTGAPAAYREYRVRGTLQKQNNGQYGLLLRCLRDVPNSMQEVGLPEEELITILQQNRSGLILVTGPTGSGKTTSIAAMVDWINKNMTANIVMIEDPSEFQHRPQKSVIISREVGTDVDSYEEGVEQVLRFAPDVVGIGEIRDSETMRAAVRVGESGHLVIATLHAPTSVGAIRKALGYLDMPGEQMSLSGCLLAVMAQALVPAKSGSGKVLAYELLDCRMGESTGPDRVTVQQAIGEYVSANGEKALEQLSERFIEGKAGGSHSMSFAQTLPSLVKKGLIDARRAAAIAPDAKTIKALLAMP